MGIVAINGIMLPLFSTWFIPVAIRDTKTGEFKGIWTLEFLGTTAALTVAECYVMIAEFGPDFWTFVKIVFLIVMTISLGFTYVFLTQKEMFGNRFELKVRQK